MEKKSLTVQKLNKNKKRVIIENKLVDIESAKKIKNLLRNGSIESLILVKNQMGLYEKSEIIEGLKNNKTLTELNFRRNNVKINEMADIIKIFKNNTKLKKLNLSNNIRIDFSQKQLVFCFFFKEIIELFEEISKLLKENKT